MVWGRFFATTNSTMRLSFDIIETNLIRIDIIETNLIKINLYFPNISGYIFSFKIIHNASWSL